MLPVVERAGSGGYYRVTDQAEIAMDIMFPMVGAFSHYLLRE